VKTRRTAVQALLAACLVAPASASAQYVALEADRSCYSPGEMVSLTGYGFTPDGDVGLSAGGQPLGFGIADYDGLFRAEMRAPRLPFSQVGLRFTATDQTYRLNRASTTIQLTSLGVRVTPATGDPTRPRRIRARGFFGGRTLYAHVRRGDRVRSLRLGRLTGACRRIDVTRRLFPAGVDPGAYKLDFDTNRRFLGEADSQISYAVKIAAASGAGGARASAAATSARGATWKLLQR
jgi:hypothetical protein